MTQDFYLKAQSLHEEFQKRELHYLNLENKLNRTMMWRKDLNLPLQEYLRRINEREKETEETYRNIMKQMDELDHHTDAMSLKLEKLGILRSNMPSITVSNYPLRFESNFQIHDPKHSVYTASTIPQLHSIEPDNLRPSSQLKSVFTQTENTMFCDTCSSLMYASIRPSHLSSTNVEPQVAYSSQSENESGVFFSENRSNFQFAKSSVNTENNTTLQINHDKKNSVENKQIEQASEKSPGDNLHSKVRLDDRLNSSENKLESNESLIEENAQYSVSQNKEVTEPQFLVNKSYESKSTDSGGNVEVSVSKSDAESMNNEFDFLESDTANTSSKVKIHDSSKSFKSTPSDVYVSFDKSVNPVDRLSKEPSLIHEDEKSTVQPNSKQLDIRDDKSETSGSASGPHSPNISVASDSDSIYEKGSSLTASAAYQALLGNTVIPTKTKKTEVESESEDEVENALASAVQRTHVKSKSSVQPKSDKSASQSVDSKPADKGSKPPLNPQSKLSKSTRKVLGLDTSSGSEVEIAIKPPGKKIDEDSDEFDFYD